MKRIAIISFSLACFLAGNSYGKDLSYKEILSRVPAAELPIKAAELVKDAKPRNREGVTMNVVKTALSLNPASAPVIVSAISRAMPEMAVTAAATAASAQPRQAAAIAKAAAAAAPSKAGKIAVAVSRVVPNDYRNVAVAAAQAAPGSDKDILNALSAAFPELRTGIERVLAAQGATSPTVSYALASVTPAVAQSTSAGAVPSLARGPAVGPPFIPISQTPTNVTPGTSGNVPPGGRGGPTDYAQP